MENRITVHKLDESGMEVWTYEGEVIGRENSSITLKARFDRDAVEFHGLLLERGDIFIETFYSDRWYNVFAIYDTQMSVFKGWYCNITRPAKITSRDIYADDLALDLIVFPDGGSLILDEDEFNKLDLPPQERERALKTVRTLAKVAANLESPFIAGGLPGRANP